MRFVVSSQRQLIALVHDFRAGITPQDWSIPIGVVTGLTSFLLIRDDGFDDEAVPNPRRQVLARMLHLIDAVVACIQVRRFPCLSAIVSVREC